MFRTITTKRDGICKRCNSEVPPGTKVRYNGFGIWHFSSDPACQTVTDLRQGSASTTPAPTTQSAIQEGQFTVDENPYPADERAVGGYPTPATRKREAVPNLNPNHPASNF